MKHAFKSTSNDEVTAAHDKYVQDGVAFHDATEEFAKGVGGKPYCRQYSRGDRFMVGVIVPEGDVIESNLWRKSNDYFINDHDFYVPNRRSNAGRELYSQMRSLTTDPYRIPGLPYDVLIIERNLTTSPGSNLVDGQWYASYGHELPEGVVEQITSGNWEEIRPSELMAIYEDEEERIEREAKESEVRDAQGNVARIEG